MNPAGLHIIAEMTQCDCTHLSQVDVIRRMMLDAAKISHSAVIAQKFVRIGEGVSGVVIIGESHLSIHTWPEHGYASVDLYSCNQGSNLELALNAITEVLKPRKNNVLIIERGGPDGPHILDLIPFKLSRRKNPHKRTRPMA